MAESKERQERRAKSEAAAKERAKVKLAKRAVAAAKAKEDRAKLLDEFRGLSDAELYALIEKAKQDVMECSNKALECRRQGRAYADQLNCLYAVVETRKKLAKLSDTEKQELAQSIAAEGIAAGSVGEPEAEVAEG